MPAGHEPRDTSSSGCSALTAHDEPCSLCPRMCGALRGDAETGVCGAGRDMMIARAALHLWEEPPISGERGSGAIFFSHCPLKCVYCQNYEISRDGKGERVTTERLSRIMLNLMSQGAVNINLVTASHYAPQVVDAVRMAKAAGLGIPVVWNTSGYDTPAVLQKISEVVDVFLPDFKYWNCETAARYSKAPNYPEAAKNALQYMFCAQPETVFDEEGNALRGVIVRHLVLPGHTRESKQILQYLRDTYGRQTFVSVMRQYVPPVGIPFPELNRTVRSAEYDSVVRFAERIGLENVFVQDKKSASDKYVPHFDQGLPV